VFFYRQVSVQSSGDEGELRYVKRLSINFYPSNAWIFTAKVHIGSTHSGPAVFKSSKRRRLDRGGHRVASVLTHDEAISEGTGNPLVTLLKVIQL
jgi:hypothetical protein